MCAELIRDFTHFVGAEEENLLTIIANLGEDFFLIYNLDILYKSCFDLEPVDEDNLMIPSFLYLITHSEFYFGMISFLRIHISKAIVSLRTALDCTFTAYYLLKNPIKSDVYLSKISQDKNPEWNKIFLNIKSTIKKDIDEFPLAKGLPEIHKLCSIYAHSDALGIFHRFRLNKERGRMEATYFDYEANTEDYKKWLSILLLGFFRIFLIYWNEVFKHRAGDKISEIENKRIEYQKKLEAFSKRYPLNK